jgi:hypothetical protein
MLFFLLMKIQKYWSSMGKKTLEQQRWVWVARERVCVTIEI